MILRFDRWREHEVIYFSNSNQPDFLVSFPGDSWPSWRSFFYYSTWGVPVGPVLAGTMPKSHSKQPACASTHSQIAEGRTLQLGIKGLQFFFADYWCMLWLDRYEQVCQTGTFEHFEVHVSLKIQNSLHQLMKNDAWAGEVLIKIGVIAENLPYRL